MYTKEVGLQGDIFSFIIELLKKNTVFDINKTLIFRSKLNLLHLPFFYKVYI